MCVVQGMVSEEMCLESNTDATEAKTPFLAAIWPETVLEDGIVFDTESVVMIFAQYKDPARDKKDSTCSSEARNAAAKVLEAVRKQAPMSTTEGNVLATMDVYGRYDSYFTTKEKEGEKGGGGGGGKGGEKVEYMQLIKMQASEQITEVSVREISNELQFFRYDFTPPNPSVYAFTLAVEPHSGTSDADTGRMTSFARYQPAVQFRICCHLEGEKKVGRSQERTRTRTRTRRNLRAAAADPSVSVSAPAADPAYAHADTNTDTGGCDLSDTKDGYWVYPPTERHYPLAELLRLSHPVFHSPRCPHFNTIVESLVEEIGSADAAQMCLAGDPHSKHVCIYAREKRATPCTAGAGAGIGIGVGEIESRETVRERGLAKGGHHPHTIAARLRRCLRPPNTSSNGIITTSSSTLRPALTALGVGEPLLSRTSHAFSEHLSQLFSTPGISRIPVYKPVYVWAMRAAGIMQENKNSAALQTTVNNNNNNNNNHNSNAAVNVDKRGRNTTRQGQDQDQDKDHTGGHAFTNKEPFIYVDVFHALSALGELPFLGKDNSNYNSNNNNNNNNNHTIGKGKGEGGEGGNGGGGGANSSPIATTSSDSAYAQAISAGGVDVMDSYKHFSQDYQHLYAFVADALLVSHRCNTHPSRCIALIGGSSSSSISISTSTSTDSDGASDSDINSGNKRKRKPTIGGYSNQNDLFSSHTKAEGEGEERYISLVDLYVNF